MSDMETQNEPFRLKMPDIVLGGSGEMDHVRQARTRLDMINWYLYASAVDEFFKRWPALESLSVENNRTPDDPLAYFLDNEWTEDADPAAASQADKNILYDGLDNLSEYAYCLHSDGILPAMHHMFQTRYFRAGEVMDKFGELWSRTQDDPATARGLWTTMLAEVEAARMDSTVNAPRQPDGKPAPRM